ncbi:hypothetical protein N7454_008918 [Penicillium verhagenii]|nr:hypothetical protein N7454_008918 [Penicillium verhagenii]
MIQTLHTIGKGFCGTVWAASEETDLAYKREDGGPDRSLKNDFEMHRRILRSFRTSADFLETLQIQIPACHNFIDAGDQEWWTQNLSRFPPGYTPCNILQSQRIPPLPEAVRHLIIEKYCPPRIVEQITTSKPDKDCLIRPYLGRRRTRRQNSTSRFTAFSLRNYPLHIDQMESLGLPIGDVQKYARAMAGTLAVMHWVGEIDGNDIEFVLAPPSNSARNSKDSIISNILGEHAVWVLDFDLCRSMTMDLNGVEQAAAAFWSNDPYYPRPQMDPYHPQGSQPQMEPASLWYSYREQYLQTSNLCATLCLEPQECEKRKALAKRFIEITEEGRKRGVNTGWNDKP